MNTIANRQRSPAISGDNPIDTLLHELSDRSSLWYDLRIAEMSGYDYVFVPDAACRQLSSLHHLQKFFSNVQTILGTGPSRTVLISYWHDQQRTLHFERYNIDYTDGIALSWRKELLDNNPQMEFIHVLFEHSEAFLL